MAYLGSWKIDDLLTFPANTHTASTGAATDADAVPDYRVYEDETGTAILTGSMAKLDDTNTTGFYSEQLTLSAANGFEKGKCYTIYISAAVATVTGTMAHTFQIEAEVDANTVSPTVSANTIQLSGDTTAADNAEAFFDGTGYAGTGNTIPTVTTVTNTVNANTVQLSGDTTAADNAEAFFDGTGYAGTGNTIPTVTTVTTVNGLAANSITASALATDAVTEMRSLVSGTSDSGTTTTMVDAARTEADTDYWKGCWILFTSGTISGQVRLITAFTPGTDTITFAPATTQAVSTETYEILPNAAVDVGAISTDSTAADNAEAFFDGTGYAGTNNVIPTTTTVTNPVTTTERRVQGSLGINASDLLVAHAWLTDPDGTIVNATAATFEVLDYDGTSIVGTAAWTTAPTETAANTWYADKTSVTLVEGMAYRLRVVITAGSAYTRDIPFTAVA